MHASRTSHARTRHGSTQQARGGCQARHHLAGGANAQDRACSIAHGQGSRDAHDSSSAAAQMAKS